MSFPIKKVYKLLFGTTLTDLRRSTEIPSIDSLSRLETFPRTPRRRIKMSASLSGGDAARSAAETPPTPSPVPEQASITEEMAALNVQDVAETVALPGQSFYVCVHLLKARKGRPRPS